MTGVADLWHPWSMLIVVCFWSHPWRVKVVCSCMAKASLCNPLLNVDHDRNNWNVLTIGWCYIIHDWVRTWCLGMRQFRVGAGLEQRWFNVQAFKFDIATLGEYINIILPASSAGGTSFARDNSSQLCRYSCLSPGRQLYLVKDSVMSNMKYGIMHQY